MQRIKTLLLTGTNPHDWQSSAPFCQDLLEQSGRFSVVLTEDPSAVLEDPKVGEDYQLFFMDYTGPDWSEVAQANFAAAVGGGLGLVILHGSHIPFEGWLEFEKMLGILWREELGSAHGQYHEFTVNIVDHDHPITQGLADFSLWDELYHGLVNLRDIPCRVLATAYSDPAMDGTGNDEPVMVVNRYDNGRVYHLMLGHVWPHDFGNSDYKGATMMTFENEGFQRVLLRGCEWAATGEVTIK